MSDRLHSALSFERGPIASARFAKAGAVLRLDNPFRLYGSIALLSAFVAAVTEWFGDAFSAVTVTSALVAISIVLALPLACVLASALVLTLLPPSPLELLTIASSVVAAILEFLTRT